MVGQAVVELLGADLHGIRAAVEGVDLVRLVAIIGRQVLRPLAKVWGRQEVNTTRTGTCKYTQRFIITSTIPMNSESGSDT